MIRTQLNPSLSSRAGVRNPRTDITNGNQTGTTPCASIALHLQPKNFCKTDCTDSREERTKHLGRELRRDYRNIPAKVLTDGAFIAGVLEKAAKVAGSTVVSTAWKNLGGNGTPPGCTCAILLDESHITAHSYADKGMLAVNVFTCGSKADPALALDYIKKQLEWFGNPEVAFADETPRFVVEENDQAA